MRKLSGHAVQWFPQNMWQNIQQHFYRKRGEIRPVCPLIPEAPRKLWVTVLNYTEVYSRASLVVQRLKASACNVGDLGSIPGSGRSPGEGNGDPLQYSCLENPRDGGAWWVAIYGVAQSRTRLKRLSSSSSSWTRFSARSNKSCVIQDLSLET